MAANRKRDNQDQLNQSVHASRGTPKAMLIEPAAPADDGAARVRKAGLLHCPITDRYFRPVSSRNARAGSRAVCRSVQVLEPQTTQEANTVEMTGLTSVAYIRATPQRVWEALTDPELTAQY